ncbi:DUF456 domain-containing protein [Humisphaera borealis]|uniref:DUF456 domain-containing protein n=1 Tax=Humisphaera borealis TaxID=2807512 RepID=A0A7M2WU67_9BACT|nr:DUF456 domain-containing protein [Humisphaera borealis]QOV88080.1 DUF456 domain-containing protein [Humisphaera borealis]
MDWLYYAILALLLICGLVLNVLTLPGNWLILLCAFLYGWVTGWAYVGLYTMIALLVLATVGEVVEFLAAGRATSKIGGSRWGSVGAIVGGLAGAIFLTGLIPIPVVGTLIGVLAGTFLGATLGEWIAGKKVYHTIVIGAVATKGRLYGTILKVVFGFVMFIWAMAMALPVHFT